jgi:hypothetical protein
LASNRNRIDLPFWVACWMPRGVSTPWLTALFKNSTLAGSMIRLASGNRWWATSQSTPCPAPLERASIGGPNKKYPTTARAAAKIPAEKLLTSISKPGLILPSHSLFDVASCTRLGEHGPMIIAPRNIGMSVP